MAGGGSSAVSKGDRTGAPRHGKIRSKWHDPNDRSHAFVHTVIDDHTRIAYAEIHDDETAATAIAVLTRAVAWYAERGITVERVLSDNGSAYKPTLWQRNLRPSSASPSRRPGPTGHKPTAR